MSRDWILASEGVAVVVDRGGRVSTVSLETPNRHGDVRLDDDVLILRLLAGFHEDKRGRPVISYLKPNSSEERVARAALARQIRNGTLGGIARAITRSCHRPGGAVGIS